MNVLFNLINDLVNQLGEYEGFVDSMNNTILDLLVRFAKEELMISKYVGVDIEEYNGERGGYFDVLFCNRITIADIYVEYSTMKPAMIRESVKTVLHEMRHMWQYNGGMEWPKEYINIDDSVIGYLEQPIEKDARNWSIDNLEKACRYITTHLVDEMLKA